MDIINIDEFKSKDKPEGRRKNKNMNFRKNKFWIYMIAVIAVIAVALAILFARGHFSNNDNDDNETVGPVINVESTEETTQESTVSNELIEDGYQNINKLINEYFRARKECDVEALSKIISNTASISEEKLKKESEYIEDYKNIKCYTKRGLLEDTYIAYVYYEYKFLNIDTTAPAMIRMYICTNDSGDVYIYNDSVDGEVASYMEEINNGEDVVSLFNDTDDRLKKAIESDENLKDFYTKLIEGIEANTVAQTEEETSEEETAEETTQSETATETKASTASEFKNTNDTAYAKQDTTVYAAASTDSDKVGSVSAGTRFARTKYNDQWSYIKYSDNVSGYVKNDAFIFDTKFIYVNETVYAKETVRIRKDTSLDSEVAGVLSKGESIKRIGYNDEFSKVLYDGEVCYIGKGYLTTAKPEE